MPAKTIAIYADNAYKSAVTAKNNGQFPEALAWDICYSRFYNHITGTHQLSNDDLALNLGMYLANWGMYRGSSFIGKYNYREHIGAVEIVTDNRYINLLGLEYSPVISPQNLKLLDDVIDKLNEHYNDIKDLNTPKNTVTDTQISKILLGTLGCVPAYDVNVCRALKEMKTSCSKVTQQFNTKCIGGLSDFYCNNKNNYSIFCNRVVNLEDHAIPYPDAKILDLGLFGWGEYLIKEDEKNKS